MLFNSLAVIEFDGEGGLHRPAWRVGTQMVGMHGAVNVIEDIVNAQLQPVGKHLTRTAKVVGGVDAPNLVALAVAVVLIVALAAASCREVHAQLVVLAERMVIHHGGIPFMVRRTINRHCVHTILLLVIQVRLGI